MCGTVSVITWCRQLTTVASHAVTWSLGLPYNCYLHSLSHSSHRHGWNRALPMLALLLTKG